MDKRTFVVVGFVDLAVSQSLLYLFGIDAILETPLNICLYAGLLLSGIFALLGGFGISIGPLSWRGFAGASYLFISALIAATFLFVDVLSYSQVPRPVFGVFVLVSTVTLLAIGADIALNRQQIVELQ